jgi:WhiB family redox-sensing transcriptional regulator
LDSVVLQPGPAVRSRWIQQDWPELAACRGLLDLFFPPAGEREPSRLVREAKARAICAECPVVAECRDYARHNRELGFWGGENDEERTIALRRERRDGNRIAAAG